MEASLTLKVDALIHHDSNSWNVEAIKTHLPQYEDQIRKLYLSSTRTKDSVAWLPTKSGIYSTKTGYALNKLNPEQTVDEAFKWQTNVWQVKTSSKLKTFLWKTVAKALPVRTALTSRGILTEVRCKVCGELGDELHIFLHCPFAKRVWDLVPTVPTLQQHSLASMKELLTEAHRMTNLPPSGVPNSPIYPWVLWFLWKARNQHIFNERIFTEEDIVLKAILEARFWQEAQQSRAKDWKHQRKTEGEPNSSRACCYVDAAWSTSSGACGVGWIIKDDQGVNRHQYSTPYLFVASAISAEALAMKSAMSSALATGFSSLQFCSDSQILISLLRSGEDTNELKGLLHDIRVLSPLFTSISFSISLAPLTIWQTLLQSLR